jgi:hypothetical protein
MAATARIAAVVVAHDSGAELAECAARLLAQHDVAELVVVDNGSRDDGLARLPIDARLRVLRNHDNPGFAVACNQGARACRATLLAFVNPDCFVEGDLLSRLADVFARDPGVGLVGADVVGPDGRAEPAARRRAPTLARMLRAALGARAALHVPAGAPGTLTEVDATSGALMVMPREVFERVGGFDEGYRLHAEDLDLCRRVRAAGLRVAVLEGARAVHLKGTSSRRRPVFVAFHKHRGLARYWWRWGAGGGLPGRVLAVAAAWVRFLLVLPLAFARQAVRGARPR